MGVQSDDTEAVIATKRMYTDTYKRVINTGAVKFIYRSECSNVVGTSSLTESTEGCSFIITYGNPAGWRTRVDYCVHRRQYITQYMEFFYAPYYILFCSL